MKILIFLISCAGASLLTVLGVTENVIHQRSLEGQIELQQQLLDELRNENGNEENVLRIEEDIRRYQSSNFYDRSTIKGIIMFSIGTGITILIILAIALKIIQGRSRRSDQPMSAARFSENASGNSTSQAV